MLDARLFLLPQRVGPTSQGTRTVTVVTVMLDDHVSCIPTRARTKYNRNRGRQRVTRMKCMNHMTYCTGDLLLLLLLLLLLTDSCVVKDTFYI